MKKKRYIDRIQKLDEVMMQYKKHCKCGHTQIVPPCIKGDYILCKWCGGRLYKDDKLQQLHDEKVERDNFRFKLLQCMEASNEINL